MERSFTAKGEFIEQCLEMTSDKEESHWLKTFPAPCPSTHTMTWRWVNEEVNDKGTIKIKRRLYFGVVPKGETAANPAISELEGASDGDLAAIAAEEGVKLTGKMTRAQTVAAIMRKREEKQPV